MRGAALVGGLVFALAPYRLGQSTGHLLGLIAFLLPAVLLALERRRFVWAALALAAIPLCGQIHLAMGAVVLALGYTLGARAAGRLVEGGRRRASSPSVAAVAVQQVVVAGSIASGGRSFAQVRHYSAELSDFVTRGVGAGIEEYVFLGWLTPLLALAGLWAIRRRRGLALFLGLAAVVPVRARARREPAAVRAALEGAAAAPLRARARAPDADRLPRDRRARRVTPLPLC